VIDLGKMQGDQMVAELMTVAGNDASIVAVGNIHGQGEVLLHELAALPSWEPQRSGRTDSMLRVSTTPGFDVLAETVFLERTHR
jgi:hypothetical protein